MHGVRPRNVDILAGGRRLDLLDTIYPRPERAQQVSLWKTSLMTEIPIPKEELTPRRIRKFFNKVEKLGNESGCHLWIGTWERKGYGTVGIGAKVHLRAHRFAYAIAHGGLCSDLCVLHKCDTNCCVNPAHLFLGTRTDNASDMVQKSRQAKGEKASRTRLKTSDVLEIKRRLALGERQYILAAQFKVHKNTIHSISTGHSWSHLTLA